MKTTPKNKKKVYLSASATVEAALVIPLFVYAVLAVMFMVQIISIKSSMMQALYDTTRELAGYSYTYINIQDSNSSESQGEIGKTLAYTTLISKLGDDFADQGYIVGDNIGISMVNSEVLENNNEITLSVQYYIQNPFDVFGIAVVEINQQFTDLAWLGDEYEASENSTSEEIVYITESGSVYHKDRNCTYLDLSIHTVSADTIAQQRNAQGGIYYACEKCGSNIMGDQLYVTDYGDRYHTSINCSKLKRTVLSIPISEVGSRRPCSKCAGG